MELKVIRGNERKEHTKKPLQYWEKDSYIHALEKPNQRLILNEQIVNRVKQLSDVNILDISLPNNEKGEHGTIVAEYKQVKYEFNYYYFAHETSNILSYQRQFFTQEEMEEIGKTSMALTSFMRFEKDARDSYILQLKLLHAIMPDALAYEDESAEKYMNKRWVELVVNSKYPCEFDSLYSVQAIIANDDDIWLHTHGLARCNIAELEILNAKTDTYNSYYSIISTLANRVLEDTYDKEKDYCYIGQCDEDLPIVVRKVIWTRGILKYEQDILGTEKDRETGHNSETELIFLLGDDEKLYKLSEIDEALKDNPILFISNSETQRMSDVAIERFSYVRNIMALNDENYAVIVKMGIKTDNGDSYDNKEHIWFELENIAGDTLDLTLTQEPYDIKDLHQGDRGKYLLADLTNWVIYTPNGTVTPESVYLLDL